MLQKAGVTIVEDRPSRKRPLTDDEARKVLSNIDEVTIAKGRKATTFPAAEVNIAQMKGPTGNFRAPMLVTGKRMLVGFSADTLQEWFQ